MDAWSVGDKLWVGPKKRRLFRSLAPRKRSYKALLETVAKRRRCSVYRLVRRRDPSEYFEHTAFVEPQKQIRLLKVHRRGSVCLSKCELTTWHVDKAPPYYAISYTWGDYPDTHDCMITVNNRRFVVTKSCRIALWSAGIQHDGNAYYWVDSICINQADY